MGMAQSPQLPGHFALSRSCTLSRLDSAWVTAQPQCQVRAHQAPWQMGRLIRALQFFTDCSAVSRLGFVSAFELSSGFVASVNWALQALESRWVCIAHLAAHAPQQRHPGPLEGLFLSGRRPEILIYFRTLNTCIKHPRECSYCPPWLFAAHAIPNIAQCLRISEANHKYISHSHL